jgi:hypothetical protein
MMQTSFQYISFELIRSTGKTGFWLCRNLEHGDVLGEVRWYGPWRQYCLVAQTGVVLSAGCLKDIQAFIEFLMEGRKK